MRVPAEQFRVAIDAAVLEDLRERLARTRFPASSPRGGAWQYGTSLDYLKKFVAHWRERYDWRDWERRLNTFEQYRVALGEERLQVHVLVERGSGANPMPIILTHGWPGSVMELIELIEPLAHPERFGGRAEEAFTVIVPGIPGYGFSQAPSAPLSPRDVAAMWHELMTEAFGFDRYMAHGGDWGSAISSWLALDYPDELVGLHLNNALLSAPWSFATQPPSADEAAYFERMQARMQGGQAYQDVHGIRPQSLAYATADSPAGLAGWILEKFHNWTVPHDAPDKFNTDPALDVDHLIANLMMYWLGDANASCWMYRYLVDMSGFILPEGRRVDVPTGVCLFAHDVALPPPDMLIARAYQLVHVTRSDRGGHFPGIECPQVLIADIRAFRAALAH
jgi:microsomal epoxide hydrolase